MTDKALEVEVFEIADKLQASGQNISVRLVLAEVGRGSLATIGRHLKAWREKKQKDFELNIKPSSIIYKALKEEIDLQVSGGTQYLKEELESLEKTHASILDALKKAEESIEAQKVENENLTKSLSEIATQNKGLEEELKKVILEKEGLSTDLSKANQEIREIEKRAITCEATTQNLKDQIQELEKKYNSTLERAIKAESSK